MPRRENIRRRQPPTAVRHTILVYCGAVRTEPDYFDGLRRSLRNSGVTIKVRQQAIAPDALVRVASDYRDRKPGVFDEVWCVVDVDEFDIGAAVAEARRSQVSLAVSNPCFDLWLLLHHADCRAYCAGYAEVLRRLRKYVPEYDKARLDFARFAAGVTDAVARAKELESTGTDYSRNPSTNMWQLAEEIVGTA
jgi:hypothetical protein